MSRVGKKPVVLPSGVTAKVESGIFSVTGPKGTLTLPLHDKVTLQTSETEICADVSRKEVK